MKVYKHRNGYLVTAIRIDDWAFAGAHPNSAHVGGCIYDPVHRTVRLPVADGGGLGTLGDWIVRYPTGSLGLLGDTSFRSLCRAVEDGGN